MTRKEIEEKIDYLERLMSCCACSREELYELEDLKQQLLESEGNDEEESGT